MSERCCNDPHCPSNEDRVQPRTLREHWDGVHGRKCPVSTCVLVYPHDGSHMSKSGHTVGMPIESPAHDVHLTEPRLDRPGYPRAPKFVDRDGCIWAEYSDDRSVQITKSSVAIRHDAWECPRCHRINAPHAQQCTCTGES